ncbi:MAG TPA: DUF885 domain-containing protein [Vicinamibacterales bacterium]|nr:DUF885 domain-containing protein [Vicinamibacterales bacterium]
MRRRSLPAWPAILLLVTSMTACERPAPGHEAGDAAFDRLAHEIIVDYLRRNPTEATSLGVHEYDSRIEDYSATARSEEARAYRAFRARLDAIAPGPLTLDRQLDREVLIHRLDGELLRLEVIRPWANDPDVYSSGLTAAAYTIITREFAPTPVRLRALVARLRAMPRALQEARRNLVNPPRALTEIAIEQIDGNTDFFRTDVPQAFGRLDNPVRRHELETASAAVVSALVDYKAWLQQTLLPASNGAFAYGVDTYRARLWDDEMIDTPLDELLAIARADLAKNQAAFAEAAHRIDPHATPVEVLAGLQRDHPSAGDLVETTQNELDALLDFILDHHIVTVPDAEGVEVQETPPFLRATTSASIDIPGPFEKVATDAYYSVTLPDPSWPQAEQDAFMAQWYPAMISNVSVHEVWPGHYLQFLYAKQFPSDVRKVFSASTNVEGWAHYSEEMVLDQGFHADDPSYRLAQLQDALLRDVRFIVGIEMHTKGMGMDEAQRLFETEAYQPTPVARSEVKRAISDATYGYYTMGKLMIQKLAADYRAKQGAAFTLQGFHDAFVKIGPLPLPLIRRAMLGETGEIFSLPGK